MTTKILPLTNNNCEHELKTDPGVFQESWDGNKPFELRFDDRDYKVGDELVLRETQYTGAEMTPKNNISEGWARDNVKPLFYTGRRIRVKVTCKIYYFGLLPGWCVLGVKEIFRVGGDSNITGEVENNKCQCESDHGNCEKNGLVYCKECGLLLVGVIG